MPPSQSLLSFTSVWKHYCRFILTTWLRHNVSKTYVNGHSTIVTFIGHGRVMSDGIKGQACGQCGCLTEEWTVRISNEETIERVVNVVQRKAYLRSASALLVPHKVLTLLPSFSCLTQFLSILYFSLSNSRHHVHIFHYRTCTFSLCAVHRSQASSKAYCSNYPRFHG